MKPYTCLSPIRIINPYSHKEMVVPCGKCIACRTIHSSHWVERLERERSSHLFSIFFTLTYNNDFVNIAYLRGNTYYSADNTVLFNLHDKECEVTLQSFSEKDWKYLNSRRKIYYPNYSLLSPFIKRLRSKLTHYEKDLSKRKLSFFLVTEYGNSTYRPHHHGILFTDSQWFAENADWLIASAWSSDGRYSSSKGYGNVDVVKQPVSCSSYVAGYINSFVSLPKVYNFKPFRPSLRCSKRTPIGSSYLNEENLYELFFEGTPYFSVYRRKSNDFYDVSVESYVKNKLFPKFRAFDQFPYSFRVTLYRFVLQRSSLTFKEFVNLLDDYISFGYLTDTTLFSYFYILFQSETSLYRFWLSVQRVRKVLIKYNVDLLFFLDRLDNFYYNVEQWKLKEQFRMQDLFIRTFGLKNLISLDPLFIKSLSENFPYLTQSQHLILQSYGIDSNSFSYEDLAFGNNQSFKVFSSDCDIRYNKSIKTKKRNDYKKNKESNYLSNLISSIYG